MFPAWLLAGFLPWSGMGCSYRPEMGGAGYTLCDADGNCPGGFVCVQGVCAPRCTEMDLVAWVEPGEDDQGIWDCSAGASCTVLTNVDTGFSHLQADLSYGDFLQMGPLLEESIPERCGHVLLRVSLLASPEDNGRVLTALVIGYKQGNPVWGVAQDIELSGVPPEEYHDVESRFRENTHFFIVNTETFGWPVELKLLPAENENMQADLVLGVREFKMYCCQSGNF